MMNYHGLDTGWIIFWMVAVAAIFALVVWATLRAGNQSGSRGDASDAARDDALTTLQRRFASGEIDDNEYQRRRNLLTQH